MWSFSYLLLSVNLLSQNGAKNPVSAFDDARSTCVGCMDCNTELSAKVLRWKSHHENCP